MRLPDAAAALACKVDCLGQWRTFERNERQYVKRADARMHATMLPQIDMLARRARERDAGFEEGARRTDRGDDAAMVHGIACSMQHPRSGRFDRAGARINDVRAHAFGNVRNDFEEH